MEILMMILCNSICLKQNVLSTICSYFVYLVSFFYLTLMSSFIYKGKMVIVGDIAVGKTSLVSRFVEDKFSKNHIASVGGRNLELSNR